jgi:predicted phosphohydrolase
VELTKLGPDNKVYAIIRENHEYYIKSTDKVSNIVSEDFKYIGGLQKKNKKHILHMLKLLNS